MQIPRLIPSFSADLSAISPTLLWGVVGIALLVFAVISAFLMFHWLTYGRKNFTILTAGILYWAGSLVLFMAMIIAIKTH